MLYFYTVPVPSRANQKNKNNRMKLIRMIRLSILIFLMTLCFTFGFMVNTYAKSDTDTNDLITATVTSINDDRSVTSTLNKYVVEDGDSLWRIAAAHKPAHYDMLAYIHALKQKNSLSSTTLHTGMVIVLPEITD